MSKITRIQVDMAVHNDADQVHRESIIIGEKRVAFVILITRIQDALLGLIAKARGVS